MMLDVVVLVVLLNFFMVLYAVVLVVLLNFFMMLDAVFLSLLQNFFSILIVSIFTFRKKISAVPLLVIFVFFLLFCCFNCLFFDFGEHLFCAYLIESSLSKYSFWSLGKIESASRVNLQRQQPENMRSVKPPPK